MLADFLRIKIYIPEKSDEAADPNNDFMPSIPPDSYLMELIEVVRSHPTVGVLGNYSGVYEVGPGLEGYIPNEGAKPTYGRSSNFSQVRNIAFVTYASASAFDDVKAFVETVSVAHPWEYPVIEVSNIKMWVP